MAKLAKQNAIFYNYEKWPEEKVLLIVGIPGVGKTTFAKKIAEFDYAKVIHLDDFPDHFKSLSKEEKGLKLQDYIRNLNERTIIEGVTLLHIDNQWLSEKPIIIIEHRLYLRVWRFVRRQILKEQKNFFYALYHGIRLNIKWINKHRDLKVELAGKKYCKLSSFDINAGVIPSLEIITFEQSDRTL